MVPALAVLVALFLIAPILIIIPMSFSTAVSFQFPPPGYSLGYYRAFFTSHAWLDATFNSFVIATISMIFTMLLVVPASFGYVRHRFRGKALFNLLMMSPLIVPHVVAALAYYGYLGAARLNGTIPGVVLAHGVLAVPIAFLVVCATLKGFDPNLERAAMSLGAGPLRTFLWVTLPALRPGMMVAALFSFLASFNEAVVSIFIAGRDATTLPKKMYESIRLESDPVIAVVSSLLIASVLGKWLELLEEMAPGISQVAVMYGTGTAPGDGLYYLRSVEAAARSKQVKVIAIQVKNAGEIEQDISGLGRQPHGALIVTPDLTTTLYRGAIISTALRHRLPAMYPFRYVAAEGGLMSYGVDVSDQYRHAAGYVDRILKGAMPRELPVQAPTKFELAINLKTAKALGLDVPPTLLARADEVIE